ncbi:MAG: hypothetical protein PHF00_03955 [Elusimicrobia bacterium]|nr:hypothetical protein [Elusimicrobiota bacterium]
MLRRVIFAGLALLASVGVRAAGFADFLPGAKAMGMGMAFSAVADDPYAMFFNPAGTANTPYAQAGGSFGRMQSPVGTLSFAALTYLRPFEPINTATVGAGYYAGRQTNGGDKDSFLLHYAQELRIPRLPLAKPLRVGGNFKFVNVDQGRGSFGAGFDGGILARSNIGLSGSLTLLDLTTNVGVPHPTIGLGTAYTWRRRLTVAGDLRYRKGLAEFYPGLEASFHQGLLKARLGRGFQLDGVGQLALGLGVNFSPLVIDVAMTVPTGGIHRRGGAYQAGLNYRFGAPSFASSFVGQAAIQADSLRSDIFRLEEFKKNLQNDTQSAESNKTIVSGEMSVLRKRLAESQDELRLLEKRKDELEYALSVLSLEKRKLLPPPAPKRAPAKPKPAPVVVWPRYRQVRPGDTLRSIAQEFYRDAARWELIYEANRDKVERGLPRTGAVLEIPDPRR